MPKLFNCILTLFLLTLTFEGSFAPRSRKMGGGKSTPKSRACTLPESEEHSERAMAGVSSSSGGGPPRGDREDTSGNVKGSKKSSRRKTGDRASDVTELAGGVENLRIDEKLDITGSTSRATDAEGRRDADGGRQKSGGGRRDDKEVSRKSGLGRRDDDGVRQKSGGERRRKLGEEGRRQETRGDKTALKSGRETERKSGSPYSSGRPSSSRTPDRKSGSERKSTTARKSSPSVDRTANKKSRGRTPTRKELLKEVESSRIKTGISIQTRSKTPLASRSESSRQRSSSSTQQRSKSGGGKRRQSRHLSGGDGRHREHSSVSSSRRRDGGRHKSTGRRHSSGTRRSQNRRSSDSSVRSRQSRSHSRHYSSSRIGRAKPGASSNRPSQRIRERVQEHQSQNLPSVRLSLQPAAGSSSSVNTEGGLSHKKQIDVKERNQLFQKVSKDGSAINVYDVFNYQRKQCGRALFIEKEFDVNKMDAYKLLDSSKKLKKVQDCAKLLPLHLKIPLLYIIAMTSLPYMFDKGFDGNQNHILSVGLGGGTIDMFYHQIQPHAKIDVVEFNPLVVEAAKKWFGVVDSEQHQIHVENGVKFIGNAVKKGVHYDAIFIDACDQKMCPPESFLGILPSIKANLKEHGIAVFNVIQIDGSIEENNIQNVVKQIKENFESCVHINIGDGQNTVLGCTRLEKQNLPGHKALVSKLSNHLVRYGEELDIKNLNKIFSNHFQILP